MSKRKQTWDHYKEILSQSLFKPLVWKRYIDDIFSLWTTNRDRIEHFIEQANNHHPTIKYTAEISDKETIFLDTYIDKGERFERDAILDVRTHFKPTETCQYTYFSSVTRKKLKKTSLKGRPSDFSVKNSSKIIFEEKITNFKAHLLQRGYPEDIINTTLSEVNFKDLQRLETSPSTETKDKPTNLAFCHTIPTISV